MYRQAQLPPRCPVQKKSTLRPDTVAPPTSSFNDIHSPSEEHSKTICRGSISGDKQPEWLNDLLNDSDSILSGTLHRRAASDSLTLSDSLVPLSDLVQHNDAETLGSCEPDDDGLEFCCTYGPNSPRRKNKSAFPEKEIASAFSEYRVQNPLQNLDVPISVSSNACAPGNTINNEARAMKRHSGQRSRVRKLQYIAELERTVHILQNLSTELSVRVESIVQQNVALSMENNTLKQQLIIMQQEKFILEGEYQSLIKELDMVKSGLNSPPKKVNCRLLPHAANLACSDAVWEMPDFGKLNLN